jgi:hypothetical protein
MTTVFQMKVSIAKEKKKEKKKRLVPLLNHEQPLVSCGYLLAWSSVPTVHHGVDWTLPYLNNSACTRYSA